MKAHGASPHYVCYEPLTRTIDTGSPHLRLKPGPRQKAATATCRSGNGYNAWMADLDLQTVSAPHPHPDPSDVRNGSSYSALQMQRSIRGLQWN
jgi:hypothetical protein